MKILFSSFAYAPEIGGIETVSRILAREFVRAGHEIALVTETAGSANSEEFEIVRRPDLPGLARLLRSSDCLFQNNVSLRHLLPALFLRKPVAVLHQTWLRGSDNRKHWNDRLKLYCGRQVENFSISRAIAAQLPFASEVVGNPYDPSTFHNERRVRPPRTLLFVGRLVSDKGVRDLLRAAAQLREAELTFHLSIVGDGPEGGYLRRLTSELNLATEVEFVGSQPPLEVARLMNEHQIVVIPSRWPEPFGVVALEGIACGAVILGSADGGLAEAIGPCGILFPNGDADELASALKRLMTDDALPAQLRLPARQHLEAFQPSTVAAKLLDRMEEIR